MAGAQSYTEVGPELADQQLAPGRNGRQAAKGPPPELHPDPLAIAVGRRWRDGTEAQAAARRDYWLNLAFFLGEQWIWWDRKRAIVQTLPQAYSPLGPGRTKITVNRIELNLISLLARLLKAELHFEAVPTAGSDDIVMGAKLAEKVLEHYHRSQDWEAIRYDAILATFLGGTAALAVDWDPGAGEPIEFDFARNVAVGTGDVTLNALNITEFVLEPNVRDYRKARWWIQGVALPTKWVQEYYELGWEPMGDAGASMSPLQHKLLSEAGKPTGKALCLVLTMFERPTSKNPKGKFCVVVNGHTIEEEDWPFPWKDQLNLVVTRQEKAGSLWLGWTMLNSALPIQFAYNHARSVIQEHMKLSGNARLMAPTGAFIEEDFTDNPGDILWYTPDLGNQQPAYLVPPSLPGWMIEEIQRLSVELDDIMHVHATSRGEAVGDRASGQALALLSESDDEPLGLMAYDQKRAWSRLGSMVLKMLETKARNTRKAVLPAARGIGEPISWNGKLLKGQTEVNVPLEAVMPKTQAANQAFAKDLWDRQILTDPRKYARMVGLPPEDFEDLLDPDAASANRENLRMSIGEVELPSDFEDHAIHISEHNRWRKSDAYRYAPKAIKQVIDHHIQAHEQLAHEQLANQQMRAAHSPALAAVPQAAAPQGSMLPMPAMQQQAMIAAAGATGGNPGGQPGGGGGPNAGGPQLPPGGAAAVPGVASAAGFGGPG